MTFKKNIYKLFLEAKLEDKESLFTEKNVMKMREKIKNEIQKLADYFLCKGGKWINICKAISVAEDTTRNDGFRISDHSANESDDSDDDAAQRREMERNLRELESDENRQIERIDEIWQSMISAEAELPYGYFDAIAATTEFTMVEELEFENVLMFHNDNDFVMEGANMKPVKKALMNISAAVGKSNIFNHIYLYKPDIIKYLENGETWQTLKNLGLSPFIWAVNLTPAPEKEIVGDLVDIWKLEQPLDKAGGIDWMDEEDWEEYVLKCECVP